MTDEKRRELLERGLDERDVNILSKIKYKKNEK